MDRDRSKGERQGVESNAEQAVIKHFEESLRRAKEKVLLTIAIFAVFSWRALGVKGGGWYNRVDNNCTSNSWLLS